MSDAVNIVKTLFPTARITSTKRSPTSKLGMANPRSYHNIGRAIDIAPIPGVKFKDYLTSVKSAFKDAGIEIAEAIEEVGKGRSKHATGDHWHIAYTAPKKAPKAPEKAPEAVEVASVEVEAPDMPEFDVEAATESNLLSMLANLGKKKKRSKKPKMMGILSGII
jgi:hypothetical protein